METAKYVMEAKGISRTYRGEVPVHALKETDLAFTEGELVIQGFELKNSA